MQDHNYTLPLKLLFRTKFHSKSFFQSTSVRVFSSIRSHHTHILGGYVLHQTSGGTSANSVGGDPDAIRAPTEESGAGAWARVGDAGTSQGTVVRPSTGSGVRAVPASHQHKRPVSYGSGRPRTDY